MCPAPSETPTTPFGRCTSCEVPGMGFLNAASWEFWYLQLSSLLSTATSLKPQDHQLRGGPPRLPDITLQSQELKSSRLPGSLLQRQKTRAMRFAFAQLITIILHNVLQPSYYSQSHHVPLAATISKGLMSNTMALGLVVDHPSSIERPPLMRRWCSWDPCSLLGGTSD